jgi:hypothetical protein
MKVERGMASVRPNDTCFPLSSSPSFLVLTAVLSLGCSAELKRRPASAAPAAPFALPFEGFDPRPYRVFEAERPASLEPAFETGARAACRYEASTWSGPLRLSSQLEAFATVAAAHSVTIAIPEGDASQGAGVSLEVLGVRMNAVVAADDLEIFLKKPRLFQGYVWAGPGAVLHWTRAGTKRVAYQVVLPASVSPAAGPPTGEDVCRELSAESEGDDELISRAVLAGRRSALRTRWRGDERVPLTRAPGQPPLAFLDTRATCVSDDAELDCEVPEPDEVLVLERRAASVRVAYQVDTVWVVGWVPDETVQKPLERFDTDDLMLWGVPNEPVDLFGANDPTLALDDAKALCAWNAPLAAETSGVMRTVGTLASGIPVLPGVKHQGWREIVLAHPALSFAPGARSWVPEYLLYPCRPIP